MNNFGNNTPMFGTPSINQPACWYRPRNILNPFCQVNGGSNPEIVPETYNNNLHSWSQLQQPEYFTNFGMPHFDYNQSLTHYEYRQPSPDAGYSTSSPPYNELPSCNAINDCQSVLQPSNDHAVVDSDFLQILKDLDFPLEAPCNIQQENPAHYQSILDDLEAGPSKQQSSDNPQLKNLVNQQPPPAFDDQMAEEPTVQEYNSTPTIDQSNMTNNELHFNIQGKNGPIPIRVSVIGQGTNHLDIVEPNVICKFISVNASFATNLVAQNPSPVRINCRHIGCPAYISRRKRNAVPKTKLIFT